MLVTLIKLLYPGHEIVNEYYTWRHEFNFRDETDKKTPRKNMPTTRCVGCGKVLTYQQAYQGHQCPGTLTDRPVTPKRVSTRLTRAEQREHWLRYQKSNRHPITFSEE